MGQIDEHWCTLCKEKLDKTKDKYIDFELIHQGAKPVIKSWKKPKGLICMKCIEADPKLKELMDAILKAGNPTFIADICCHSVAVCKTYQPSSKPRVNCWHISVIGDTVYCKRSHPGTIKLMVEKAERIRYDQQAAMRLMKRAFKNMPCDLKAGMGSLFAQGIKTTWVPPSAIISAPIPKCMIEGCQGQKDGVVPVNKPNDHGGYRGPCYICQDCADRIGIKAGEDLPMNIKIKEMVCHAATK